MGRKRKAPRAARPGHIQAMSQGPSKNSPKIQGRKGQSQGQGQGQSQSQENKKKPTTTVPTIPFAPDDAILLVGDGDLSFAASLVAHHACTRLTATVLEASLDELAAKYPQAAANAAVLADSSEADPDDPDSPANRLLFGVDARTMGAAGPLRALRGRVDRVLFNFPHVGGKSTDVNRQVRYNQELLVAFFRRALFLLAPGGAVVVTLFEGEPYTLWNVRDLARHAGLQVERSFRFAFSAYPGYHHARTLGVVKRGGGGDDDTTTDASSTAWRGDDRPSRSYVFVRKGDTSEPPARKRKRPDDSSSDDDEDD